MNHITRLAGVLVLAALVACAGPRSTPPRDNAAIVLPDGSMISEAALLERLAMADVVVIGEVHDNPAHHQFQARIVRRLAPGGLAFEMFPETAEAKIAKHLAAGGAPGAIGELIDWSSTGWPDFALYGPIFEAAPGAVITGGRVAREALFRSATEGAVAANTHPAMTGVLTTPLDADMQAAAEAEMVASHCGHLDAARAGGMVETQRLRDASFAAAVLRARTRGEWQVVLIAGSGHARTDRGVPAYLRAVAPELKIISIGQIERETLDAATVRGRPFDFVRVTPPFDRPDPCANFKKRRPQGS